MPRFAAWEKGQFRILTYKMEIMIFYCDVDQTVFWVFDEGKVVLCQENMRLGILKVFGKLRLMESRQTKISCKL